MWRHPRIAQYEDPSDEPQDDDPEEDEDDDTGGGDEPDLDDDEIGWQVGVLLRPS